jgi:hypothetical protein
LLQGAVLGGHRQNGIGRKTYTDYDNNLAIQVRMDGCDDPLGMNLSQEQEKKRQCPQSN